MMTWDQKHCMHAWARFSIAFLGRRWQCNKCDVIAPKCFVPRPEDIVRGG